LTQAAYTQEVTPDAQGSTNVRGNFLSLVERPDEELLIFELKIGDILLSEAIVTYEDLESDQYYIPVVDFFDAMEFAITTDPDQGTAEGWSLNENTKFSLSLNDGTVSLSGSKRPIKSNQIENHADGIYVSLEALEEWFPLTVDVDFSNLAIVVNSLQALPVENRLAREVARGSIRPGSNDQDSAKRAAPLKKPPAPHFTLPFIDTSVQTTYTNNDAVNRSLGLQFSTTGRSVVFNQDAFYTINESTDDNESPDVRLTLSRSAFEGDELFGGLQEYALGDVISREIPLLADSNAGRGLSFSNISPFKTFLGASDDITLRGELAVGYQVDLKRNGELLAFIEEPDENGEYVFEDLDVFPGLNVFELVFYGPQGQEDVQERRIFVPQNPVEKGGVEYRVHAIQDNTNLFTNRDDNNEDTGELRVTGEATYGLSKLSSLRVGAATYSLDGERQYYGLGGLSTSWKGVRLDLNQAFSDEGTGSSIRLLSGFKGLRWQVMHEFFNDFISEDNENTSLAGELEHRSEFRVTGILPFLRLKSIPITLEAIRLQNTDGDEQYEWSVRATRNIKKIRITGELEQIIPPVQDRQTDLNLQLSSRFNDFTLRGTARYAIEPDAQLEAVSLTSDIAIDPLTKLRLGIARSGADDPLHTVTAGLSRDFKTFLAGFNATYDDDNDATFLLNASFGFAYNQLRGEPYFSSKPLANSSGVFANAYYDINADSIRDDEEQYIDDVGFVLPGNKKEFRTRGGTGAFIPELRSFERSSVEVLSDTFPNPFMRSNPPRIDYLLRPSQTHIEDYPVTLTGEVDGSISIFRRGSEIAASSIQLDVKRPDGDVVASGKSEFDGFFFIEGVPMGAHQIIPNTDQLNELGYCPVESQSVILAEEEPFYSVADNFILYPDPQLVDKNRWIVLADQLLPHIVEEQKNKIYDLNEGDDVVDNENDIFEELELVETPKQLDEIPETPEDNLEDVDPLLDTKQATIEAPKDVLRERYTLPSEEGTDLYRIISGPYNELESLQTCTLLKDSGYECLEITQLECTDFPKLDQVIAPQEPPSFIDN